MRWSGKTGPPHTDCVASSDGFSLPDTEQVRMTESYFNPAIEEHDWLMKVYPNPFGDHLRLELSEMSQDNGWLRISLLNMLGKPLQTWRLPAD